MPSVIEELWYKPHQDRVTGSNTIDFLSFLLKIWCCEFVCLHFFSITIDIHPDSQTNSQKVKRCLGKVCKQGSISWIDLRPAPSYLRSTHNFWEAFYWRKSSSQGAKYRRRAQNSLRKWPQVLAPRMKPLSQILLWEHVHAVSWVGYLFSLMGNLRREV